MKCPIITSTILVVYYVPTYPYVLFSDRIWSKAYIYYLIILIKIITIIIKDTFHKSLYFKFNICRKQILLFFVICFKSWLDNSSHIYYFYYKINYILQYNAIYINISHFFLLNKKYKSMICWAVSCTQYKPIDKFILRCN